MTGGWLLANDSNPISDCTGGRIGDAVRYCQSEQNSNKTMRKFLSSTAGATFNLELPGETIRLPKLCE